ncbi:MAG: acyltransferase [Paludibacteraceae bacterium]|nr:acyltransferase [Paludibacteraceae bacterium]
MGKNQRIAYLDIARGLAVLLVIFYHVPLYIQTCCSEAAPLLAPHIQAGTYILPFFMPVFFVISGYFTKTDKPYWQFLWGDIKHLLLTCLGLMFINVLIQDICLQSTGALRWFFTSLFSIHFLDIILGSWFVTAIFVARQLYYWVEKVALKISVSKKNWQFWAIVFVAVVGLAICGILVEPYAPHNNQWFYCQGLVFVIFIAIGRLLREYPINKWTLLGIGALYVVLMFTARVKGISTLEYGMINSSFTLAHWPFYMLLAITGSSLLIALAQMIQHCAPLEFFGRHSLMFYVPQGGIILVTATWLVRYAIPNTPQKVIVYILVIWAAALIGLSLLSWAQDGCKQLWGNVTKTLSGAKE